MIFCGIFGITQLLAMAKKYLMPGEINPCDLDYAQLLQIEI
jgi:hypothetical protein